MDFFNIKAYSLKRYDIKTVEDIDKYLLEIQRLQEAIDQAVQSGPFILTASQEVILSEWLDWIGDVRSDFRKAKEDYKKFSDMRDNLQGGLAKLGLMERDIKGMVHESQMLESEDTQACTQ